MITKIKRKAKLIKKFTKGSIRLSTANGSHIRKNKKSTFKGIVHCLCKGEVYKELKVDIMQFMSNQSRMKNINKREEVMESIRTENKKRVKEEAEILKKCGFGEVK